MVMVKV